MKLKVLTVHKSFIKPLLICSLILPYHAVLATPLQVSEPIVLNSVELPLSELQWVGDKVYQNECASDPKYLSYWGKGEEFPSFGIGHFIWYVDSKEGPYQQTFPQMVAFVSRHSSPPKWLNELKPFYSPWKNKTQFDQAWSSSKMMELRQWLLRTKAWQAEFIVQQFTQRFHDAMQPLSVNDSEYYQLLTLRLLQFKQGRFALIDYANFKGIGNDKEQYQGQQWGLLSVLKTMDISKDQLNSLTEKQLMNTFKKAAKSRLLLRTQLAPKQRDEQRWLAGWYKRIERY